MISGIEALELENHRMRIRFNTVFELHNLVLEQTNYCSSNEGLSALLRGLADDWKKFFIKRC